MKKNIRKPTEAKWCAPEHHRSVSSWKGDKLMTSNFIKIGKRKRTVKNSNPKVYHGLVPIVRLPKYVEEFYNREGGRCYPKDAVIMREQNNVSPYDCYHDKGFRGGFINDNHMNAVTIDGKKENWK